MPGDGGGDGAGSGAGALMAAWYREWGVQSRAVEQSRSRGCWGRASTHAFRWTDGHLRPILPEGTLTPAPRTARTSSRHPEGARPRALGEGSWVAKGCDLCNCHVAQKLLSLGIGRPGLCVRLGPDVARAGIHHGILVFRVPMSARCVGRNHIGKMAVTLRQESYGRSRAFSADLRGWE
jgi:hypothetical protein